MKAKNILTILFTGAIIFTSCSLKEDTSTFASPSDYYKNKAQCVSALNGCYIPLKSLYNYQMMIATEGCTDLAYCNSGTQDAQLDITPAKPRFGADVWTQAYKGVRYCNGVIEGIEKSALDEEVKAPLIAEGKVMRAFYYYLLTSFFGDVPYYTCDVSDTEVLAEVSALPRMSAVETREDIIEDLQDCVMDMEQIKASNVTDNRSGAAMGWMLIAKMAMWNQEWETALNALLKIEEIYGDLSAYPLSDIPFRNKNTAESIFEIQHTYSYGGLIYTSNVACICMPYPRNEGTSNYSGVEILELGDKTTAWSPMRPNNYFVNNLMVEDGGDAREEMSVLFGHYNGKKFSDTRPAFGPKFWCPGMVQSYDSNNYKIFRYADAILMMSECYAMLKNSQKSMEYLNMVKRRAGIAEYETFRTYARLMEEIMAERGRELFGEFQRKFDLVRWGNWYTRTNLYNGSSALKANIQVCHEYYPIPDTQVILSGHSLDNKAYKLCGL